VLTSLALLHLCCAAFRVKYPGSKVECGPALDLTSQASVKAFAQAILKRPGGLHILVNNAGLGYTKKSFTEEGVGMLTQVC
jgi:WW domain-containing oxidoreductase